MRLALAAFLLSCAPAERPSSMQPCRVPGLGRVAECGIVEASEVALHVVRLRGQDRAAEPLFLLAGGPGQAATEAFPAVIPFLGKLAGERDLVMVDQRGTGSSAPLDCPLSTELSEQLRDDALRATAQNCAAKLDRDVGAYLTNDAADDLEAVREALGYARIDVLGVSYGTRLGLVYARRHPASLRAMVLDGLAPPWMAIPQSFAGDGQRALDEVLKRCAASACGKAFPDLKNDLDALLASLEREPQHVTVPHPRTGEPLDLDITRDGFALGIRSLLYAPEAVALLPFTIARAVQGDFAPFVALSALFSETAEEHMSLGLLFSVVCNEDVPRSAPSEARGFVGNAAIASFRDACAAWPKVRVPEDYYQRVKVDAPALLLSGALDPVTPPRWGDDVLRDLPRGRHVVVPGMGHGVTIRSCVPELIRRFLSAPETELDTSCVRDEAPPFFIDAAGPPH